MNYYRPTRVAILLVIALALGARGARAVDASARNAARLSITSQEIKDHVGVLADDTFEGRESGSRGNRAAGIYIIERLKKLGLRGGGPKQSYYQNSSNYSNILALVEGRDPAMKDQVIVVSAHYDHVGYGSSRNSYGPIGRIHNGADDNASGVAGLLEVADAICQLPEKPRRSILFTFWDGEEKGLLGSQYWLDHPTVPLNRVSIMINVDMIGRLRNSRVTVYGVRTSQGLRRLVSLQNEPSQLLLDFSWELKGDSDHYGFYSRGIPIVMFHTGMHDDYHRPSDDADKINSEGLTQISQLMFNVLVELADGPALSGFRRNSRLESRGDQQLIERALAAPPGRLGIRIDSKAAAKDGIVVSSVTPGSAAEKGGLRLGDRVVRFANQEVHDAAHFPVIVLAAVSPAPATIERPGESKPLEVSLDLPGEPVRLGISWRTDDAEPGVVIVNRVIPGSLAELAGLRVNDRIYRIRGREFANADEFRQRVAEVPDGIALEVETSGRVHLVEIPPVDATAVQPASK
jgi:hypothetical protein